MVWPLKFTEWLGGFDSTTFGGVVSLGPPGGAPTLAHDPVIKTVMKIPAIMNDPVFTIWF